MQTSTETSDLFAALAKAQGEMQNANLNKINPHFRSKYADLAAIRDATIPALAKHGLSILQGAESHDGGWVLVTRLTHASGQWIETAYPLAHLPNDPQKQGSAMTYAKRYAWSALCGIAADEDDDGNAAQDDAKRSASKVKQAAPETKDEPFHVKDARAIVHAAEKVKPDEWDAFFDGLGPRLADIRDASKATYEFTLKRLGEIEASMKVAA